MNYNWQLPDWRNFMFSEKTVEDILFDFTEKAGHLKGLLHAMPQDSQEQLSLIHI